jgi:hypothetical protein
MTDARDPASLIEAAQKAVGEGDFSEAERLLREAAAKQEADPGTDPSDLATTLNNLAFVCERLEKYDEAERGYRRAHAIAVASLSPGHPLIKTSLTNLLEFCAARGIPVWTPPAVQPADESVPLEGEPPVEPGIPVVTQRPPLRMIAAAAVAIVAIVAFIATRQGQGTTETPRSVAVVRQEPPQSPVPRPAPSAEPNAAPSPAPRPRPSPATPAPSPEREPRPAADPALRPEIATGPVTVLKAQLCTTLQRRGSPDWQCTAADGDLKPGAYTFYTRLLTNATTTVEHRWYQGERVHQVMRLRITPSPGSGYRTFSGNTVSPERAGEWKVELRAADGSLLHEERFVVR